MQLKDFRPVALFSSKLSANASGEYEGVLIIEVGKAKGHFAVKDPDGKIVNFDSTNPAHAKLEKYPIVVTKDTLADVVRCGQESEGEKCKLDHGSTVRDVVGAYTKFRLDGNQVRADLKLFDNTPHRGYVEELFAKMSKKVGNSIDFDYYYEIKGKEAVARVAKLNSVDIVDSPAATNSLFQNTNSNPEANMPLDDAAIGQITTALRGVVKEEISSQLGAVQTEFNGRFDKLQKRFEEGDGGDGDDKKKKNDEEGKGKGEGEGDDAKFDARVKTAVFAALKEALPKAALQNLAGTPPTPGSEGGETYETKFAECKKLKMSEAQATRFIAANFPDLYNAKFGGAAQNTKL